MLKHYEGELGIFDYDDTEFKTSRVLVLTKGDSKDVEFLQYIGEGLSVNLPTGCINTRYMFSHCKLPEGFTLGDKFDTSKVENMSNMFSCCELPEGFNLRDKFDTSNVKDMEKMFYHCKLPEGKSEVDFKDEREIIAWLKTRKPTYNYVSTGGQVDADEIFVTFYEEDYDEINPLNVKLTKHAAESLITMLNGILHSTNNATKMDLF